MSHKKRQMSHNKRQMLHIKRQRQMLHIKRQRQRSELNVNVKYHHETSTSLIVCDFSVLSINCETSN